MAIPFVIGRYGAGDRRSRPTLAPESPFPDHRPKKSALCPKIADRPQQLVVYTRTVTQCLNEDRDRRVRRTRAAVSAAFVRLLFEQRYESITTVQLIAAADIGRSTFYEHFRSKDDVLIAVIDPLFTPLAEAASGHGNFARLHTILEHLWEQRGSSRIIFDPARLPRLQRRLAEMIEHRSVATHPGAVPIWLMATANAAAQLAMIRAWLAGEAPCTVSVLARHIATGSPGTAGPSVQQRWPTIPPTG